MDLSIIERLKLLLSTPFSSFLLLEIMLVIILLLIFLFINETKKNGYVKALVSAVILFSLSFSIFLYQEEIFFLLKEMGKIVLRCFYFPNIIFYIVSVLLSVSFMIYSIFAKHLEKKERICSYLILGLHLWFFLQFMALAITKKVSLSSPANIYRHDDLFVIVQASQLIFLTFLVLKIIFYFVRHKKNDFKKDEDSAIMNRK